MSPEDVDLHGYSQEGTYNEEGVLWEEPRGGQAMRLASPIFLRAPL